LQAFIKSNLILRLENKFLLKIQMVNQGFVLSGEEREAAFSRSLVRIKMIFYFDFLGKV
jgi:hypothetical protein